MNMRAIKTAELAATVADTKIASEETTDADADADAEELESELELSAVQEAAGAT